MDGGEKDIGYLEKMLIYLADLVHDYFPGLNTVPLNIGYIAAYAKACFGKDVEIQLFKYTDEFLDAIDKRQPSLIGLSNYIWNYRLNAFVGKYIKESYPQIPIVMGGPNIRFERDGIASFLKNNSYVDIYCMLEGEIPFSHIIETLLNQPAADRTADFLRSMELDACFSFLSGELKGRYVFNNKKTLDYIPSPYTSGILERFLKQDLMMLFETNRGCPYFCSYCNWGAAARKKMKLFSMERVKSEVDYVAAKGIFSFCWTFTDANFGILKRDVEIARHLRRLYNRLRPFNQLEIWWDKSAKGHMKEIAESFKGLSNAYIAFQSFDPLVLNMINRKNIPIDKVKNAFGSLYADSEKFSTDILLGLPGETAESHLRSLSTAFNLGFDRIGGGEIRLLLGSDLETGQSRKRFGLKTKYRLVQEGFGMYKGNFVFELEEVIRSTNWMTEEEMIRLRVLRAIFYGSITIGEHLSLMKYLRHCSIDILDLFHKIVETRYSNPLVAETIDWLIDKANREWFNTPEEADVFFSNKTNYEGLLSNPVIKLNYDWLSNLLLSIERYKAFSEHIVDVISRYFPLCNSDVVREILMLCEKRNYIIRCLKGESETEDIAELSYETTDELGKIGVIPTMVLREGTVNSFLITIDENNARLIRDYIKKAGNKIDIQTISMIIQKVITIHMTPQLCKYRQDTEYIDRAKAVT